MLLITLASAIRDFSMRRTRLKFLHLMIGNLPFVVLFLVIRLFLVLVAVR